MAYSDVPWHRDDRRSGRISLNPKIWGQSLAWGFIRNFRVWGLIRRFSVSKLKIRPHFDQRSRRISLYPKFGVDRWHGGLLETLGYGRLLEALGFRN